MPAGKTHPRPIRWPSREFLDVLDAIYARQGTNLAARMIEHAMADIERDGTSEEKDLAREHLSTRARPGRKPKNTPGAQTSAADELKAWAERRNEGLITEEEFEQKKAQLLGL